MTKKKEIISAKDMITLSSSLFAACNYYVQNRRSGDSIASSILAIASDVHEAHVLERQTTQQQYEQFLHKHHLNINLIKGYKSTLIDLSRIGIYHHPITLDFPPTLEKHPVNQGQSHNSIYNVAM